MQRGFFQHDGLNFSYLDSGEGNPTLLMLHAHWMGASDFEDVAPSLAPDWRVVALDQRGHGQTDHGGIHSVDAYIGDVDALLDHLGLSAPVVLLGHSFGGMVANLYAAARPSHVRGLIMEDIDVARQDDDRFMLDWAGYFPTRQALEAKVGEHLTPYLRKSMVEDAQGWRLTFEPEEVLASERALNGDHWAEWLAHDCPALVIRGARSPVVPGAALEEMVRRRPNTRLVTVDAGHSVHIDAPEAFVAAVAEFLASLG